MAAHSDAIVQNIARVRERIARASERAGRTAGEITLVAISKTCPAEAIRAAYEAGVRHFGENRVQEFEAKSEKVRDLDVAWHMIGHVQSNKARKVVELFSTVDSVDRLSIAGKLDGAVAESAAPEPLPVLIEVKLGGEASKSGVEQMGLAQLAEGIVRSCPNLLLRGLMTIPPYADDPRRARPHFEKLRQVRDQLSATIGLALPVLSMGMTHDFEVAVEEGATEVRIGTAIFGERRTPQ
ncbi:MAG: YggS family pyridoxal phosphate-dependent enzyme [Acidobacteriota bacterium]|nr:YggS family pyridoxal phosphate-dependent enzyme [Acidobacteriota bacterium]